MAKILANDNTEDNNDTIENFDYDSGSDNECPDSLINHGINNISEM